MAAPTVTIRLDKTKPHSPCSGERTPADPHYRVHWFQVQKFEGQMVQLPFDAAGELVPDDGKTEPYQGLVEGKPVMFKPLYTDQMRRLVEEKMKRRSAIAAKPADGEAEPGLSEEEITDEVDFVAWLKGEVRYEPQVLRSAAKARFKRQYSDIKQLAVDLVLDERLVPEDQVSPDIAVYLRQFTREDAAA